MTPSSKATVAPAPATPAQIYLRAADATQLTQLEINGKPQNTEEQDGMKRLSWFRETISCRSRLSKGDNWQHSLQIDEGSGTWLVNVPTPAG